MMNRQALYRATLVAAALSTSIPIVSGCVARVGYYDPDYHDYHRWNAREDGAYRSYLSERHEEYRDFSRLDPDEQRGYWQWRHSHPDGGG